MFIDFFVKELDLFLFLIRDREKNYDSVRIICPPVLRLYDIVFVGSLKYKHARVVSWQHGGNYGYMDLPLFFYHDLVNCDVLLGYGVSPRKYADMHSSATDRDCYRRCARVEILGAYRIPARVARRDGRVNPDPSGVNIHTRVEIISQF